jgi:chromosome segregation ATPase
MGLLTAQIRVACLQMRASDLQFQIQTLTQTKMNLAASNNQLVNIGTDLDPDSPELKLLNQRQAKLQLVEKNMDAMLQRIQDQLKMVEKEQESANKYVEKGMEFFKY